MSYYFTMIAQTVEVRSAEWWWGVVTFLALSGAWLIPAIGTGFLWMYGSGIGWAVSYGVFCAGPMLLSVLVLGPVGMKRVSLASVTLSAGMWGLAWLFQRKDIPMSLIAYPSPQSVIQIGLGFLVTVVVLGVFQWRSLRDQFSWKGLVPTLLYCLGYWALIWQARFILMTG